MISKLTFGLIAAGVVLLGLMAQAGAYLLAPSAPGPAEGDYSANSRFDGPGPHGVGTRRLTVDTADLPVSMWYPATEKGLEAPPLSYAYAIDMFGGGGSLALAGYRGRAVPGAEPELSRGPYPLVILSPGFAIGSTSYAWLGEQLASHGFVVMAPDHDESLDPRRLWRSTVERPRDVGAVLAFVDGSVRSGGEFAGLIDEHTVAVVGHSYGGYTALAVAGGRLDTNGFGAACTGASERDDPIVFLCDALLPHVDDMAGLADLESVPSGLWPGRGDSRVEAVVAMAGDAAMFGARGLAGIDVPVLVMGGTADTDSPFRWGTGFAYEHVSSTRKIEVAFEGAEHMVFAGRCETPRRVLTLVPTAFCSDPAWDRETLQQTAAGYATAFLLAELKGDIEARSSLTPAGANLDRIGYRAEGY